MSGGSQHNPNGRQSQLGSGWSPLQLQMANLLARAPQVHVASERGVTWHTPTPPPHMYHVPAPSPPDPLQALLQLQAMKSAGNSVFRHTATPPEMFRHTPTPPDKHMLRHSPSPGDAKSGAALPPADLFPHLGPARDKHVRPEDFLAYSRGGVDLSIGSRSNGSPNPSSPSNPRTSLSVRDAPTINSLIARAQPRHPHARVDALLERLAPSPVSPHSVIVHSRAAPTPSPPSSNEDSTDSCGGPPGSKRKRKPERTVRLPTAPAAAPTYLAPTPATQLSQVPPTVTLPQENGERNTNGAELPKNPTPPPERRKTRSGSAETIDDIAAMIASTAQKPEQEKPDKPVETPVSIDKLKSVLASPGPSKPEETPKVEEPPKQDIVETAAAPKRRSARTSNSESTNVPVESPSEAKPAEAEVSNEARSAEPTAASFVEVENQLEKMFAGIEEPTEEVEKTPVKKRRKSAPGKGEKKSSRRRVSTGDEPRRKGMNKKAGGKGKKREVAVKDAYAYDSGSNASSGRSRGPYIQIRGPRDSPLSVSVINASTGEEEGDVTTGRRKGDEYRNGLRARGLHASTLGLRYDAVTADATWLCAFCSRGPHAAALGDLFGPYAIDTDCEEYKALDEVSRQRYDSAPNSTEVWFHENCGVWAPGLLAAGARLWGISPAVWGARGSQCALCRRPGAALACGARGCPARAHLPCATAHNWRLDHEEFRSHCPLHEQTARVTRHIRLVGGDSAQIIPLT